MIQSKTCWSGMSSTASNSIELPLVKCRQMRFAECLHEKVQLAESRACSRGNASLRRRVSISLMAVLWHAGGDPDYHAQPGHGVGPHMTSFEFFTVLLSFVVSLGVASLLQPSSG